MNKLIVLLLAGSLLLGTACGKTPPPPTPPVIDRALAFNRDGIAYEGRGDSRRARTAFVESQRLSASVEYTPGVVAALVSLARLDRRDGDLSSAANRIARAQALVDENDPLRYDVAFEAALFALAGNDPANAQQQAELALAAAGDRQRGPAQNLLARTLAASGAPEAAHRQALAALERCRTDRLPGEAANAARLLGDLETAAGRPAGAAEYFRQALAFDREAALSPRIADDLRRLADASVALGDLPAAIDYRQRASEVALNHRDHAGARADLAALVALYTETGNPERAAACEQLRGQLPAPSDR